MRIIIETIPHAEQRYPTVGDWFYDADGALRIKVSQMVDPRYCFLVALHELVEVQLCRERGITQDLVDRFDMQYESTRPADDDSEPGDDPQAPYKREHCTATGIERILAAELNVDWKTYEATISAL